MNISTNKNYLFSKIKHKHHSYFEKIQYNHKEIINKFSLPNNVLRTREPIDGWPPMRSERIATGERVQGRLVRIAVAIARNRSGGIAVPAALLATALMGFVGLGVDVGAWYLTQARAQKAADAGALGAARSLLDSGSEQEAASAGAGIASMNGFADGDGAAVSFSFGPANGWVEALVEAEAPIGLSGLFVSEGFMIPGRARAAIMDAPHPCMLALDPDTSNGIWIENNGSMHASGCDVVSNSEAVNVNPWQDQASIWVRNGVLTADNVYSVEDSIASTNGHSVIEPPAEHSEPVDDPLEDFDIGETPSHCDHTNHQVNWGPGVQSLGPGAYCGGLRIQNGARVNFQPGTYYIKGDEFSIQGGSEVTGSGVTFVLTGSSPQDVARAHFANNADISLSAPTIGANTGMLMYQERWASPNQTNHFAGNADFRFDGALYFPNRPVRADNNVTLQGSSDRFMMLIAHHMEVAGSAEVHTSLGDEAELPFPLPEGTRVVLVR